jgi:hypothetical protein
MKKHSSFRATVAVAGALLLCASLTCALTFSLTSCDKEFQFNSRAINKENIAGTWAITNHYRQELRTTSQNGPREVVEVSVDYAARTIKTVDPRGMGGTFPIPIGQYKPWHVTFGIDGNGSLYMIEEDRTTPIEWELKINDINFSPLPDLGNEATIEQLTNDYMKLTRKGDGTYIVMNTWSLKRL